MNVTVSCEFRFFRTPDGLVWTTSSFKYEFWLRYLEAFSNVTVVARIQDVQTKDTNWQQACGKQVVFYALPYYVGLLGLFKKLPAFSKALRKVMKIPGALILRVPSQTAMLLTLLNFNRKPYALEVIGDPYDVFSAGVGSWLTAPIMKFISTFALKRQCKNALAVSYVTKFYLQQRYPPNAGSVSTHYSSIMLTDKQFADAPKRFKAPARKLVFVGSVEQLYKAPEILIQAFSKLVDHDINYSLTMLGAGKYIPQLKEQAKLLGIRENVNFVGEVSSADVINYLNQAEVFVLASRTEGLPRATIEAMARGLPCVGSDAGGIPELLPNKYCAKAGDIASLYTILEQLTNDVTQLNKSAKRNHTKSYEYKASLLSQRRSDFYKEIRNKMSKYHD